MKRRSTFLKKNKEGSTLVLVVGICSILLIFLTTSLSVAQAARQQTYLQYNKNQAYYSANSAVNLFAGNIETDNNLKEFISNMSLGSSFTSNRVVVEGLGEVEYIISKSSSGAVTVTAKAYYNNAVSQSSVLLSGDGVDSKVPKFNAAAVSLEKAGFSNGFIATGDIVTWTNDKMQLTNTGKVYGSIYTAGNIEANSDSLVFQGGNDEEFSIITTGEFYITNNVNIDYSTSVKKAFINCNYFKASTNNTTNLTIGKSDKKLDIYCNYLRLDGSESTTPTKYNANIYVYNKDGSGDSAPAYIARSEINGDVYINGDVDVGNLSAATIKGDLIVTGTLNMGGGTRFTVKGNVYCNKLNVTGDALTIEGGKIYTPNDITGSTKGRYEGLKDWNESRYRQKLASQRKPAIPDPEKVFEPYQVDAEDYIDTDKIDDGSSYDLYRTSVIEGSGKIINSAPSGSTITIKVSDKPIWLQIDVRQFDNVTFIIEKSPAFPETPVYFVVPQRKEVIFNHSRVITKNTLDKINNGEVFYVGNYADTSKELTKGQEVYWLLCKESTLRLTSGGPEESGIKRPAIEGYIYGPKATVVTDVFAEYTMKYSLDGVSNKEITPHIIGAVIAQKVAMSNQSGILYLIPRSEGLPGAPNTGGGGGISSWKVEKFVRK